MPPPFNIDNSSPGDSSLINAFPGNERSNRSLIEEWLAFISDPATGLIRPGVLPSTSTFPAGTKMTFVQTAAPTSWTKDITHNNKALRIVNGAAGTGGTAVFTSVFASRTPAGTVSNTTATGSINNVTVTGSVGNTALTEANLPSHTHSGSGLTAAAVGDHTHNNIYGITAGSSGGDPLGFGTENGAGGNRIETQQGTVADSAAGGHSHSISGNTGATGSGTAHGHSLTMDSHGHTFTGTAHNHTFTGTAMDFDVQYVDVIIATKD